MFADEFELSFAGNISALTIGVATGVIGMALFAGFTQGEKVPPEIRIKNQSETDRYRIKFNNTYRDKTKKKKRNQRLLMSGVGALAWALIYLSSIEQAN